MEGELSEEAAARARRRVLLAVSSCALIFVAGLVLPTTLANAGPGAGTCLPGPDSYCPSGIDEARDIAATTLAFLGLLLSGVTMGIRGHKVVCFAPAALVALSEAFGAVPLVVPRVTLLYGWLGDRPPFWVASYGGLPIHELLLVVLLAAPVAVAVHRSAQGTGMSFDRLASQLVFGGVAYLAMIAVVPERADPEDIIALLFIAFLLGTSAHSARALASSALPLVVMAVAVSLAALSVTAAPLVFGSSLLAMVIGWSSAWGEPFLFSRRRPGPEVGSAL